MRRRDVVQARARVRPWLAAVVLVALMLTACDDAGILRGSVVLHGSHELGDGSGHVLLLGGTARIPEGATVAGTVVALGDRLSVAGRVSGDLMVLGGEAELGPAALVDGTLVIAGATVERSPGSVVRGGVRTDLDALAEFARPAPTLGERAVTLAVQAVLLMLFAWLVAAVAARPLGRIADAAVRHVAVSGAMGILAGLVATVLLVVMAFTVVLIPVTVLVGMALLVAVVVGWTAWGAALANAVVRRRGGSRVRPVQVAWGTVAVAGALALVSTIPMVGSLGALLVTVTGFGAVLVTGFGMRRFVPDVVGTGAEEPTALNLGTREPNGPERMKQASTQRDPHRGGNEP